MVQQDDKSNQEVHGSFDHIANFKFVRKSIEDQN